MSTRKLAPGTSPSTRRGVILVLFALLVVGFLAIAGIAIDLGLARMTQRQMQGATDSVALEALRERDYARNDLAQADPYLRDIMRRTLNGRLAAWRYTPDLSTSGNEEEDEQLGAGGYVLMSGGQGALNWGRTIDEIGWSAPRLRSNYNIIEDDQGMPTGFTPLNLPHGDIVSGSFSPVTAGAEGNPFHLETSGYLRPDFAVAQPSDAPQAASLLVRMRRTRNDYFDSSGGLDEQDGVSSNGPTLPMLFSAGGMTQGGDPATGSLRHTGLRIRSTSIATARRAVRVGLRVDETDIQGLLDAGNISEREAALLRVGVTSLILNERYWRDEPGVGFNFWTQLENGDQEMILNIDSPAGGGQNLLRINNPEDNSGFQEWVIGYLVPPHPRSVGDQMPWPPPDDPAFAQASFWAVQEGLLPIYNQEFLFQQSVFSNRIIGFGRVRAEEIIDPDSGQPVKNEAGYSLIRLVRLANEPGSEQWIAPRNASARFDGTQADDMTPSQWENVLQRWSGLPAQRLVHAPALAR